MPPPPPVDRTATLAPRDSATVPSVPTPRQVDVGESLPVDDPDRYQLIGEHARGGLGRVVAAVDKRLGRTVAVKELLRHDHDSGHEARFMREALITARLQHPGIVPVHEAGRWPNGEPYYVMKLVEGRTLKALIAERKVQAARLELLPHVIALADAVGYAHSEGVIHRDLKPSNVMVGAFGETIVVDWGLARDRKQDLPEPEGELVAGGSGTATISGKVVGTPGYMAPEQARGDVVDERADVYSLGAVLYELLAGTAPHSDATPQAMLDRVIAGPPTPLAQIAAGTPRELADIVAKAMARQPDDRYPNATAIAEDLRRFQTGKLVSAHAYTVWQLLRKRLAAHRGVVAVAAASAIALGTVGVEAFRHVVAERDIACNERERAEDARRAVEQRKRELVLVQAETSLPKDPTASLAWLAWSPIADADLAQVVDVVDEALASGVSRHVLRPNDWVLAAVFTPDGNTVIAGLRDGRVMAYETSTGHGDELGQAPAGLETLALSPDGEWAVTAGSHGDVRAWPVHGGSPRLLVDHGQRAIGLKFTPSGHAVVVHRNTGPDDIVELDGRVEHVGPASATHVLVAAKDSSRRAALIATDEIATLGPDGPHVIAHTPSAVKFFALSPSGDTVVVHDGQTVWTLPFAGGPLKKLATYDRELNDAVWSPDCQQIALVGWNPDLVLVDVATGAARTLRGHTDQIYSAQFTRDGRTLLTASDDGTARVWNLTSGNSLALRGHDDDVYRVTLSPDERLVATASIDGSLRVWSIAPTGARVLVEGEPILDFDLVGDRALVRTSSAIARWDLATGKREPLFSWDRALDHVEPSPDGNLLAIADADGGIELRRRNGAPIALHGHRGQIRQLVWSKDSSQLYTSAYDGTITRWDTVTGVPTDLVRGGVPLSIFAVAADGRVATGAADTLVVLDPDGEHHVIGSGSNECYSFATFEPVRDRLIASRCMHDLLLVDGATQRKLPTGGYPVVRVAVSRDGERIAAAMGDRTIRVWDSAGGLLYILRGHSDLVRDVAFSPDGTRLASASYDKTIRIWQLGTERHRVLRGHAATVDRIAWRSPLELVSASQDGTLRVWDVPSTALPTQADLARRITAATTARIDDSNRPTTPPS